MKELFKKVTSQKQNKIICIGKNYLDHVNEMGGSSSPKAPTIFTKPFSAIVIEPNKVELPNYKKITPTIDKKTKEISKLLTIEDQVYHYELELGFQINREIKYFLKGKDKFSDYVKHYFLGLDLTNRTYQQIGKDEFTGWFYGKELDNCLPMSKFFEIDDNLNNQNLDLEFRLNGELKQKGNTKDMIFNMEDILEYVSKYMTLYPGDLFLTGTPAGVGSIKKGDIMEGKCLYENKELMKMRFEVDEMI